MYVPLHQDRSDALKPKQGDNNILHIQSSLGNLGMVEFILSQTSIDKEGRGEDGRTPIMMAALNGMTEMVKFLEKEGCNLDTRDDHNNSILHLACFRGSAKTVTYILSRKTVDMNTTGQYGRTPVMIAAYNGQSSAMDVLVKNGCKLSTIDNFGNNILHVACLGGSVILVSYILSQKVAGIESQGLYNRTPLMLAVTRGHKSVVEFLINENCDLTKVDEDENNILHLACIAGDLDMVKYVHERSGIDIECSGRYGWTSVMMAAEKGHKDVFDYLVGKECKLNVVDKNKNNLFHIASIGGNVEIVKELQRRHIAADLLKKNKYGNTPLATAATLKNDQIVQFFFNYNERKN